MGSRVRNFVRFQLIQRESDYKFLISKKLLKLTILVNHDFTLYSAYISRNFDLLLLVIRKIYINGNWHYLVISKDSEEGPLSNT